MIYSFDPIADRHSGILILGTMPGEESLRRHQYYGHERNHFWRIIYALFGKEPDEEYEKRKEFLLKNRIALWDVIRCCSRDGSLDSGIKNAKPNDISDLLEKHKEIKAVFFNGQMAHRLYRKMISAEIPLEYYILPSTSPARTLPFEEKLYHWMCVRKVLDRLIKA